MATSNKTKNQLKQEEQEREQAVDSAVGKTELFFKNNDKLLTWILIALVVVVGGYFAYKYLIAEPRAEKASSEMFAAVQQFNAEAWDTALNGDGNNAGFLEVIENYGSTPQASLAAHYAGVSYLKLGDKENALKYLKKYDTVKGAPAEIINAQNYGLQGDIYADGGEFAKAISLYKKAVKASDNALTAPYYLKKLGLVYEQNGNKTEALAAFQRIADEYFNSLEARDIEVSINRLK